MEEEVYTHVAGTCANVRCMRVWCTCIDLLAGGSRTLLDHGSRSRLPNGYRKKHRKSHNSHHLHAHMLHVSYMWHTSWHFGDGCGFDWDNLHVKGLLVGLATVLDEGSLQPNHRHIQRCERGPIMLQSTFIL